MIDYKNISDQKNLSFEMYNSENSEEAAYAIANKHFENAQKIVKDYLEGIKQKYEFFASN